MRATKTGYGWPPDEHFRVPEAVRERCDQHARGAALEADWNGAMARWQERHPELAQEWSRRWRRRLPDWIGEKLPRFSSDPKGMATRVASGKVLNAIADECVELIGGSADLAPSCKTLIASSSDLTPDAPGERNIRFGIREHGMAGVLNGLSLHGGFRPYGSTFLVFSDYMRPAIRLAALMEQPVIYVFTHDSIWVGEDGPTHQPVEHIAALRAIPNLVVVRPADANETSEAWRVALDRIEGPTALLLSRQGLPVLDETCGGAASGLARGGYLLKDCDGEPELVLLATGAEVALAVAASRELADGGRAVRVVSMPSWELFEVQPADYRAALLPEGVPRLAVEAGVTLGWHRWVGDGGDVVGIDRFGASAPGKVVAEKFGLTVGDVVARAERLLGAG